MAVQPEQKLRDASVESLPQVFRGYDRAATKKLLEDLREVNWNLLRERVDLEQRLANAEQTRTDMAQTQQRLTAELERMRSEYDGLALRERALRADLDAARREIARFERRELLLTGMVDAAKRTSERIKEEARAEGTKALKKAREREAEMLRRASRNVDHSARERERLSKLTSQLRTDLSAVVDLVPRRYIDELAGQGASGNARDAEPPASPEVREETQLAAAAVAVPAEAAVEPSADPLAQAVEPPAEAAPTPVADTAPVARPSRAIALFAYTGFQIAVVVLQGALLVGLVILALVLTRVLNV